MKKIIEVKDRYSEISYGCDKCTYSHRYWDEESEIEEPTCKASMNQLESCIINDIHYEEVEE